MTHHIWLFDNNRVFSEAIKPNISFVGHNVTFAENGMQALLSYHTAHRIGLDDHRAPAGRRTILLHQHVEHVIIYRADVNA